MSDAAFVRDWRAEFIARQRRVIVYFQHLLASPHTPVNEHIAIQRRIDRLTAEIREADRAVALRFDAQPA